MFGVDADELPRLTPLLEKIGEAVRIATACRPHKAARRLVPRLSGQPDGSDTLRVAQLVCDRTPVGSPERPRDPVRPGDGWRTGAAGGQRAASPVSVLVSTGGRWWSASQVRRGRVSLRSSGRRRRCRCSRVRSWCRVRRGVRGVRASASSACLRPCEHGAGCPRVVAGLSGGRAGDDRVLRWARACAAGPATLRAAARPERGLAADGDVAAAGGLRGRAVARFPADVDEAGPPGMMQPALLRQDRHPYLRTVVVGSRLAPRGAKHA